MGIETRIKIKRYLEENRISQHELGRRIGRSAPKVNMALQGKRKLTLEEYALICGALGVNTDFFLKPKVLRETKN